MGQQPELEVSNRLKENVEEEVTPGVVEEETIELSSARFREAQIRHLAYQLWQERGYPLDDAPENDWYRAERILFGNKHNDAKH